MVFLKLKGIDDINQAETLRNLYLKIDREKMPELPEDSYYIADLLGCIIETEEGENLGILEDIFNTGSNDIYVVKNELGKQILLPAIGEVIKKVDIPNRKIIVKLMEGLV